MAKKYKYPIQIQTEFGNTIVKFIPPRRATKIHKCPFCEEETEFLEAHLLFLPTVYPDNRRYGHIACFERLESEKIDIVIHPKLPYLSPKDTIR